MSDTVFHPTTPASIASRFFPHEPDQDDEREALKAAIEAYGKTIADQKEPAP